ncbi:MAG TPA: NapC/NirT family cytochrome c [Burkholderiales bacterium]|nr:NapC/NirT family cytochrome c [Burkholderiales bacterium]
MLGRWWEDLKQRCATCSRVTLATGATLAALLLGGVLLAAGAAGLAWTNTESFCISCHEMRDNVYAEFKGTIHDTNRSGVRAICADCHVPREPVPMLVRKVEATFELYGKLVGTISTKEKFEAKRYELAKRVWKRMKETDSLECRNCHTESAMNAELQSQRAKTRHAKMKTEGLTCIDCHFGIAHKEPEGPGPREMKIGRAGR